MSKTNKFKLIFNDDDFEAVNITKPIKNIKNESDYFEEFDRCFSECVDKVNKMTIKHAERNEIINFCTRIVSETFNLMKNLDTINGADKQKLIELSFSHALAELRSVSTRHLRENKVKQQVLYVGPQEKSIGLTWKSKKKFDTDLPDQLKQCTFQYISIVQTLETLFKQSLFVEEFMKYNEEHTCIPGVYERFCCGKNHKNIEIFREKCLIQLQIGIDDFEIAHPLKSKTKKYKMCGIYLQIRNIPHEYSSKLNNIFLIALCKTSDLKQDEFAIDHIIEHIVNDLKTLETDGIRIASRENIKAVLINLCFDNLGGNELLRLPRCFNANYFCRICECTLIECQNSTYELKEKLRCKLTYMEYFKNGNTDVVPMGFEKYCLLNDLRFFNIFDNLSVDVMHDFFEGLIPTFLHQLYGYCIKNKVASLDDIIRIVRDFNYCTIHFKNKPSLIQLKANLNQNATQLHCLMLNTPFMFYEYREKLYEIWPIMQSLLQCIQIVCSLTIKEKDVVRLEQELKKHLEGMKTVFGRKLKAKHHIATHYARTIRMQGPVIPMWMTRFESKHQFFTHEGRNTRNFINLPKTLAEKHQIFIASTPFQLNEVNPSKLRKFRFSSNYLQFDPIIQNYFGSNIDKLNQAQFFIYNSHKYSNGLMVIENRLISEIKLILSVEQSYFFICEFYELIKFNYLCNSIEIRKCNHENRFQVYDFSKLNNKRCYEKRVLGDEIHIIADTLLVFDQF